MADSPSGKKPCTLLHKTVTYAEALENGKGPMSTMWNIMEGCEDSPSTWSTLDYMGNMLKIILEEKQKRELMTMSLLWDLLERQNPGGQVDDPAMDDSGLGEQALNNYVAPERQLRGFWELPN